MCVGGTVSLDLRGPGYHALPLPEPATIGLDNAYVIAATFTFDDRFVHEYHQEDQGIARLKLVWRTTTGRFLTE